MEFLILLIVVIILVLVLSLRSDLRGRYEMLNTQLQLHKAELKRIRERVEAPDQAVEKVKPVQETIVPHKTPAIQPTPIKAEDIARPVIPPVVTPPIEQKPKGEVEKTALETMADIVASARKETPPPVILKPAEPKKPGFFERNPDLEKFIGENLANKIGIGILVLGIGYFVKLAIDNEWIGEIGRVFVGIVCGGILLGTAHWLRKKFAAFSSVLVGGGIAVLYLTIYIAFHDYKIFDQTTAFILMLIITGFAVIFSLTYNRMELAILSILGGFASPFMVSTGEGNYIVLFTYVLILDAGMLVLAYFKKWNPVNIVAYVFTLILFGSWLGARFDGNEHHQ